MIGISANPIFSENDSDLVVAASAMLDSAQAPFDDRQRRFLHSDNMITFTPSGAGAPARIDRKSPFSSEHSPQPSLASLTSSSNDHNVTSSSARPPRPSAAHSNGQDGPSSPPIAHQVQMKHHSPTSTVRPRKLCNVFYCRIFL